MPYKDPQKRKEYNKKRYWEHKKEVNDYNKNYSKTHKTEISKNKKEYYNKNLNKMRKKNRKYYENNRDDFIKKQKEYANTHKEEKKKYDKEYRKTHKKERVLWNNRRRIRKLNAGGSHTIGEWENLKAQYNWTCPSCNKKESAISLTRDHIVPLVKGGSDNIENIQPLCRSCNAKKYMEIKKYDYCRL